MICCVSSLAFYVRRRSRIILVLIILNFIFTALGFYAKLALSYWGLLGHAIYTISVIGALYIYILIDSFLNTDPENKDGNPETLGSTMVMIITSLPMLCLFFMGWFSLYLCVKMEEEINSRKNQEQKIALDKDEKQKIEAEMRAK